MVRSGDDVRVWRTLLAGVMAIGLGLAPLRAEEIVVTLPGTTAEASASASAEAKPLTLCIEDIQGNYTIPFVQSSRELSVRVDFTDPALVAGELRLMHDGRVMARQRTTRQQPSARFANLGPGQYSLECRGLDRDSQQRSRVAYDRIGIGTVIAALGDSITEGYFSRGFKQEDLNLTADRFPAECVSRDGRNYPQFSPTTAKHLPCVNCFESWMTPLNDSLAAWRQPVFIANEGWGGITTGGYLAMMRNDAGWKKRMHRLEPQLWLIHLGVNDQRAHVKAADVRANLAAMVDLLIKDYRAKPAHIFLATPSYDYFAGAAAILQSYAAEIKGLITERGLSRGPDFYEAFSKDRARWYGKDPVHPNLEGMARMAKLWHEALLEQLPSGPPD